MNISCSCLCCSQDRFPSLEAALAKIRELGFSAFDLDAFENWQHVTPSRLAAEPGYLDEVAGEIANSGLHPASFNCGPSTKLGDSSPEAFQQYKKEFAALLELADRVGCPNITLQPGPVLKDCSVEEQMETMKAHLSELAEMKGRRRVTIGLEGHAHTIIEKPRDAIAMIESLWPDVGYTYDPSHPELQGIDLRETECLFDYVCHVHLRNASLGNMQETMAAGTMDFEWLLSALARHGYEGGFAIEYFNDFDPEFASVLQLRDLLIEWSKSGSATSEG